MFTLDELKSCIAKALGISKDDLNLDKTFKKIGRDIAITDKTNMFENISVNICNKFGISQTETFTVPSKRCSTRSFYGHLKKEYQRNPKSFGV